jgi:hypothetical protein
MTRRTHLQVIEGGERAGASGPGPDGWAEASALYTRILVALAQAACGGLAAGELWTLLGGPAGGLEGDLDIALYELVDAGEILAFTIGGLTRYVLGGRELEDAYTRLLAHQVGEHPLPYELARAAEQLAGPLAAQQRDVALSRARAGLWGAP